MDTDSVMSGSTSRRSLLRGGAGIGGAALAAGVLGGRVAAQADDAVARSLIFCLGDGMGPSQRLAGQLTLVGPYERLAMDTLPVTGMVGTGSTGGDTFVTDSAASATAYATGHKTVNGALGVDVDGNRLTNIVELAKAAGKAVGFVTDGGISGATVGGFTVHVPDRDLEAEVARQLVEEAGVDLILTYGEDFPLTGETLDADGGNGFIALAESLGYTVITDPADLDGASAERLIGLFPNADGDSPVTVDAMLVRALDLLSAREAGFFLLIENDDIDSFAHDNDAELTIAEVVEFDGVVATAIAYAEAAGDTLLLVTADHETGGMAIENPAEADGTESDPFPVAGTDYTFTVGWTTLEHSGVPVPLTAMGPGSDRLVGTYENTAVFGVMCEALGLPIPDAGEGTPVATPAS